MTTKAEHRDEIKDAMARFEGKIDKAPPSEAPATASQTRWHHGMPRGQMPKEAMQASQRARAQRINQQRAGQPRTEQQIQFGMWESWKKTKKLLRQRDYNKARRHERLTNL